MVSRTIAPALPADPNAGEDASVAPDPWLVLLNQIAHRPKRVTERKQDRSKRTEQQILNAALRVFARDGLSRARIADIAAEAGISTSTLYEYYKSKEDLAYDLPLSYLATFFESYREAVLPLSDARNRLLLYLSMSADFAREHAEWARLFYLEIWPSVFVSETELRHNVDDFARVVVFLVQQGATEGRWSATAPYQSAALLLGAVNQVIITWLLYRRPRNLTKAGSDMAERVVAMLEQEGKASAPVRRRKART